MEHFCGGGYPLQRIRALFSINAIRGDMMTKKLSQNTRGRVILNLFQDLIGPIALIWRFRNKFGMTNWCFDNVSKAWLTWMLVLAVIGCMAAPALAQNCRMEDAQNHYDNMRLIDAIRLLEDCRRG